MADTNGKFYLGRLVDPDKGKTGTQPLLYDPADLTTHAVVVGMTGSGKTGLCLDVLEEAALAGLPVLAIDPKGDITNALLHFPDLLPGDFRSWVNPDEARRAGKTLDEAAASAAERWKDGLAAWDIPLERIQALKDAVHFAIFTPGSDAGLSVSILASLKAPEIPWEGNREVLREKISGTVTALLGLVGLTDIDPVRSREHILLANIFEDAWKNGRSLDLATLILQTQNPPFAKLGAFDVNTFFPEKDRSSLAFLLNNILAAPSFQSWIEGQPLDIGSLLYHPDGRPRHSIFYIAHLSDAERMFFVTLLLSTVEAWMRSQAGTTALRTIVYFDEIFGYLPPVGNPPSKPPLLRLLKQARAFGVGLVLVTQNPVDIDYKALSNTGSWFIGKLQTEQDKQRLLDGLQGAVPGVDRSEYDRLISGLGKRVFLLHNVHASGPVRFETRWTMNYLAGPLTRSQIPDLNALAEAEAAPSSEPQEAQLLEEAGTEGPAVTPAAPAETPATVEGGDVPVSSAAAALRPAIPAGTAEYFMPNSLTFVQAFKVAGKTFTPEAISQGLVYRPALLAQAGIRFINRKYNLDYAVRRAVLVTGNGQRGMLRWENFETGPLEAEQLEGLPEEDGQYGALPEQLSNQKSLVSLQKGFLDWVYRTSEVVVRANEPQKIYAGPEVSQAEFLNQCRETARQGCTAENRKATAALDKKIDALQSKLAKANRGLKAVEDELGYHRLENIKDLNLLGALGIGRGSRAEEAAKRRHVEARAEVAELNQQLADLENEKAQIVAEINQRWTALAGAVTEIRLGPAKKDVALDLFGVVWLPYHMVKAANEIFELPGFGE